MGLVFIIMLFALLILLLSWKGAVDKKTSHKGINSAAVEVVIVLLTAALILQWFQDKKTLVLQETIRVQQQTIEIYEQNKDT